MSISCDRKFFSEFFGKLSHLFGKISQNVKSSPDCREREAGRGSELGWAAGLGAVSTSMDPATAAGCALRPPNPSRSPPPPFLSSY